MLSLAIALFVALYLPPVAIALATLAVGGAE